ncbi:MAG: hypothetical protein JW941_08225 [Candidatus Coatesbacteria bacterium]|nr:hypothetical protein [Candidatus Coatesbacteria bacterium]
MANKPEARPVDIPWRKSPKDLNGAGPLADAIEGLRVSSGLVEKGNSCIDTFVNASSDAEPAISDKLFWKDHIQALTDTAIDIPVLTQPGGFAS